MAERCRRCNRRLKDAKAIAAGIGKKCKVKEDEESQDGLLAEVKAAGFDGYRDGLGGIQLLLPMEGGRTR